jgi:hypothetical protein
METIIVMVLLLGGAGLMVGGVTMLAGPAWGLIAGGGLMFAGGCAARWRLG